MGSDRLERITTCMAELERIRETFGKNHPQAVIIQVGECDWLSELHRLLWEWDLWYNGNRASAL
jgi:hypothetical protein